MEPMTAMALTQGATSVGKYLWGRYKKPKHKYRIPDFLDTAYGKRLESVGKTGMYNPAMRSRILGGIGKETANVASQARTGLQGRLIASGMEGSIAGQRALSEPELQRMRQLGGARERIDIANEQSRAQAQDLLAQKITETQEMQRQLKAQQEMESQAYNRQLGADLISGVGGAVSGYFQGKHQQKLLGQKLGVDLAKTKMRYSNRKGFPGLDSSLYQLYDYVGAGGNREGMGDRLKSIVQLLGSPRATQAQKNRLSGLLKMLNID